MINDQYFYVLNASAMPENMVTFGNNITVTANGVTSVSVDLSEYKTFTFYEIGMRDGAINGSKANAGALIDAERNYEIWYPVLGYRRGVLDVTDVRRTFEKGDLDYLYANGVNPIRKVSGKGIVIWGQKTLQSAPSALDRINVRMMLIKIEPAIEEFLDNYIGEFNTAQTRAEVTSIIEGYLRGIEARNGIRGFKVICDTTNNTPTVIENNQMEVWTYVKPPYATEYITNKIIITPESVSLQ
jgi:hypothetical protein